MFYEKRDLSLELKWENCCGLCCINCIDYGTGNCNDCCDSKGVKCEDCAYKARLERSNNVGILF